MSAPPASSDPQRLYAARAASLAAERDALDARSRRLSRARLALAAVIAVALLMAAGWRSSAATWAVACAALLAFAAVAVRHARVESRRLRASTLCTINRDAAARVRRQWNAVEDWTDAGAAVQADPSHPYAADLDVLGHASLWRLVGRARSEPGDATFRAWLLTPAPPAEVASRQASARALAPALDWRQEYAADGLRARRMRPHEVRRFLEWCEGGPWLQRRPWVYAGALALVAANATLDLLAAAGLAGGGWSAALAAAVLLSLAVQRPLATALEGASWEVALRGWRDMADRLASAPAGESARLAGLRARVTGTSHAPGAVEALDALGRVLACAALRHTPVLHWPVQAITLWDFHVWWALERWQRRHGPHVRGWLDALAEVEALAALASLAHDHPDWSWPRLDTRETRLSGQAVRHPLLPPDRAVANDVVLGPPGRVLFVTGSNMSGKSTLLRALGLNAVLAQAGGPVAASSWCMPPLDVVTSMRVQDSIEAGVSYFMASLERLRLVVTHARAATLDPSRPLTLYLLDELLGGTNTAEREVAVRRVVGHLAAQRAIGALTSHDLSLADSPELRAHGDLVHFRETLDERGGIAVMRFDYRLRPGVATSRNALALMRAAGLGELE